MAWQFGFLARLTWWEYSWDIMEPVTYFVTYGTSLIMYAYFVLTREVSSLSSLMLFQEFSSQCQNFHWKGFLRYWERTTK